MGWVGVYGLEVFVLVDRFFLMDAGTVNGKCFIIVNPIYLRVSDTRT